MRVMATAVALLLSTGAWCDSLSDARALVAQARTLQIEAGGALGKGDQDAWMAALTRSRTLVREADRLYRAAGIETSTDVALLAEYAGAMETAEDFDLSAEAYGRCASLEPDNAEWHLARGRALMRVGESHRTSAGESLRAAVDRAPDSEHAAEAHALLADIHWEIGHFDLALKHAQRSYALLPEGAILIGTLAALYARDGHMYEADRLLNSLQGYRGDELQVMSARLSKALRDFRQRRVVFEDTPANHTAYARLLLRMGQAETAKGAAQRATQLAPEDPSALNALANVEQRLGNVKAAIAAYEQSLRLNPEQPGTRRSLAVLRGNAQP